MLDFNTADEWCVIWTELDGAICSSHVLIVFRCLNSIVLR